MRVRSGRHKRHDRRCKRVRAPAHPRVRALLLVLAGLAVLATIWIAATGLLARHELEAMSGDIAQLRTDISSGNIADAKRTAAQASERAHRAHELTTGPAWWVAASVPWVGDPVRTSRGVSASADLLASRTVPDLIQLSTDLDPTRIHLKNDQFDIGSLVAVTPRLDSITADVDRQQQDIGELPRHTWFTPANRGATSALTSISKIAAELDTVDRVVHAAPTLLGFTTPQRYFVGFQNEAEARGTGGLPGAFGIVVADHGSLTFTHFGSDSELDGVDSGLDLGTAYDDTWHDFEPTTRYLNSDVDPDFRYAAQIWAAMWQKKSGEHIDGAVSLDPTALSYFLAVTGPATMPDGSKVSAANIVDLTQRTAYSTNTNMVERRTYLLTVARVANEQILGGSSDAKSLYAAASRAATERRLQLWTSDESFESMLSTMPIGGAIANTSAPYVGPVVINYAANKLDYYLHTQVQWVSANCGTTSNVTVTITLTNRAPTNLPLYVTQRTDKPSFPVAPGDNQILLYYVGTQGGGLTSITIDGQLATVQPGTAGSHPTYATLVELPRNQPQTIVLNLVEPSTSASPVVLRQPMITPADITTRQTKCAQ